MWVLWWTNRCMGRFFSGFLTSINIAPPFLHIILIILFKFVSFVLWWCVRLDRPSSLLITDHYNAWKKLSQIHPSLSAFDEHVRFSKSMIHTRYTFYRSVFKKSSTFIERNRRIGVVYLQEQWYIRLIFFIGYNKNFSTRGGYVVTHGTRIQEVPGSIPGADQSDFSGFPISPRRMLDWKLLSWKGRLTVNLAWSVQSLPSNRAVRVRFPAKSGILIATMGLSMCLLPVFCPVLSIAVLPTFFYSEIQRGPS